MAHDAEAAIEEGGVQPIAGTVAEWCPRAGTTRRASRSAPRVNLVVRCRRDEVRMDAPDALFPAMDIRDAIGELADGHYSAAQKKVNSNAGGV